MAAPIFTFDGAEAYSIEDRKPTGPGTPVEPQVDLRNKIQEPSIHAVFTPERHVRGAEYGDQQQTLELMTSEACATGARTPPTDIAMPPVLEKSRIQSHHRSVCKQDGDTEVLQSTDSAAIAGMNRRRKKRHSKKEHSKALNTIHGFTPATSEDERSDFSVAQMRNRNDFSNTRVGNIASNAAHRSSSPGPGVSVLTQQLESLQCGSKPSRHFGASRNSSLRINTEIGSSTGTQSTSVSPSPHPSPTASQSSATSESMKDCESSNIISYEVALEYDFVSPEIASKDDEAYNETPTLDHVVRKMTASDFEPLRCLGKGTYGTVHLVKQARTGRLFAQKQFRKASLTVKQQLIEQTKTERAILESINRHPYVVKLFYAFQDQEKLYLILEYAQGGELFTWMLTEGMFPEETAAFYMAEMILALNHLHNTVGVVYRDLKPENCLLDAEGHLLLTDFGLSKVAVDGEYRCRSMTGTLEYMAPEVIQQQSYGPEVDWWSFAVLGFEMLVGKSPFQANNDAKIQEKIVKSKLVLPFFMSGDAKDLLTRLLRKKPKERLGARMPKDLQLMKGHRFFRKIDWTSLEKRQVEPPFRPIVTDPALAENFSTEFTDLAISPATTHPKRDWGRDSALSNPFGGFSFVASRSLLTDHDGFF
ncbi:MAG: hypothetical protein LQ343_001719 [Gyalolechia ehrenbergii]|nr:MAG: hypothetical protein LQ343_001719 [Gyalolechia ehrenbergii]